jgi:translation initiation factor eIF-2B subunit gamma
VLSSRDPLASALARSTTSAQGTSITYPTPPPASPIIEDIETPVLPKLPQEPWQCQVIITAPPTPPNAKAESDYLIRVNSLAGYWELNRRFIRSLAGSSRPTDDLISPSAQISPDSLLGEGTRVGERASVKKCIVGRHCVIGKGAKLTGCILWDFVTVEEK